MNYIWVSLKKYKNSLLYGLAALFAVGTFLLVYSPHFDYKYPYHIDEWHHISQTRRLLEGNYLKSHIASGFAVIEMGFHIFLYPIAKSTDLVLSYQYLPALWAMIGAVMIFIMVKLKTKSIAAGLGAMLFFASLKSNVNVLGLWFFTPLTFSIPFVYLYAYLFSEGLRLQNKKMIVWSLVVMIFLVPVYATAVLFLVPAMLIYMYLHREYIAREANFFWWFLLIPLAGMAFYRTALDLPWIEVFGHLQQTLQFKYGWGVVEEKNAWTETYSIFGYVTAVMGAGFIWYYRKLKEYSFYLLWPITLLLSIELFRETGISFLAPYQRNFYYFAVGLPILSAVGLLYLFKFLNHEIDLQRIFPYKQSLKIILFMIVLLMTATLAFKDYYAINWRFQLYEVVNEKDYKTLKYSGKFNGAMVIAPPFMSTAMYAISGNEPFGDVFFIGNREVSQQFFEAENCEFRENIIANRKIDYVISPYQMNCGWELVYGQNDFIYRVDLIRDEQ